MFPDAGPQSGNGWATSAINQQNNSLLGAPQVQSTAMPTIDSSTMNTTAPLSSSTNPNVANMIQALKGGI